MAWPTTNDPKTEFSTQRYTVNEMAEIDSAVKVLKAAGRKSINRSEYIRNCVARCQAADARKQARRAQSEGEPD